MAVCATAQIEIISTWLYQARISRGIPQEELALRAGIAVPTYGRLERAALSRTSGGVKLDTFLRLLSALDPNPQEILALLRALGIVAKLVSTSAV